MSDHLTKFDYNFSTHGLNYYVKKKPNVIASKINLINWIYTIHVFAIKNHLLYLCRFFWLVSPILIEPVYKKNTLYLNLYKYISYEFVFVRLLWQPVGGWSRRVVYPRIGQGIRGALSGEVRISGTVRIKGTLTSTTISLEEAGWSGNCCYTLDQP